MLQVQLTVVSKIDINKTNQPTNKTTKEKEKKKKRGGGYVNRISKGSNEIQLRCKHVLKAPPADTQIHGVYRIQQFP
jgi:hypothetical protein